MNRKKLFNLCKSVIAVFVLTLLILPDLALAQEVNPAKELTIDTRFTPIRPLMLHSSILSFYPSIGRDSSVRWPVSACSSSIEAITRNLPAERLLSCYP